MALNDFLSDGASIPAGSALTAKSSETVLPSWYTDAAMQGLSNANALMQQPYQTYQGPRVADLTDMQKGVMGAAPGAVNAWQPGMQQAQGFLSQAGGMSGVNAATPWLNMAGGSLNDVSSYMNPYQSAVVDRIAEIGNRNLNETIMPGIESRYIRSGQLGGIGKSGNVTPSGMLTDTARAIRDTSGDILAQQNAALQQGYLSAQQAKNQDLTRYGTIGQTFGNLTNQQQQNMTDIARTGTTMAGAEQQYGMQGLDFLNKLGEQQRGINQQNLDWAGKDWQAQQDAPWNNMAKWMDIFKGIGGGVPTGSKEAGLVPTGQPTTYNPSTAATIGGVASGIGGILSSDAFKNLFG